MKPPALFLEDTSPKGLVPTVEAFKESVKAGGWSILGVTKGSCYDLGSGTNGKPGALSWISPIAAKELNTITLTVNIGGS